MGESERLERLEALVDRLTEKTEAIRIEQAEYRGAHRVYYAIAAAAGAIAGIVAALLGGRLSK